MYKQQLDIYIREMRRSDLEICILLFQETVHSVNRRDYLQIQLDAWAPKTLRDMQRWETMLQNISYVAEVYDQVVGFGDITHEGYIDRLFVHKDYQRMGIASNILQQLELQAKSIGIKEIKTEASITAKPFFLAFGYQIAKQQIVEIRGVEMVNFLMIKSL